MNSFTAMLFQSLKSKLRDHPHFFLSYFSKQSERARRNHEKLQAAMALIQKAEDILKDI